MSLKRIAKETLSILREGSYLTISLNLVDFSAEQQAAERGTRLYTPRHVDDLLDRRPPRSREHHTAQTTKIEVTNEKTTAAAYRMVVEEGCSDLVLLNYASARKPGGGFLTGAMAQEEDLTRCSGLYPCLLTQPAYYDHNRSYKSLLYTDHIIYSPDVPWFRITNDDLLEDFFLASVITAPAPNTGQLLRQQPDAGPDIEDTLYYRAGYVLSIAQHNRHRSLILGAWGCGVFRNDPHLVADIFGQWLESPRFEGYFDRVVFAVYDPRKNQEALQAFQERFAEG
ncbi:MAG: TIGR02452 family protein [Chloroflexota bacterium]